MFIGVALPQRLCIRIAGPEVLQDDERVGLALVLDADTRLRHQRRHEELVFSRSARSESSTALKRRAFRTCHGLG